MDTRRNPLRMILILVVGYGIQITRGKPSDRPSSSLLNDLISNAVETINKECERNANSRVSWWNSLNGAIDDFIREFERQHNTSITRFNRQLRTADWPVTDNDDGISKKYFLDFLCQGDGAQDVQSSVIVVIPELGYLQQLGKTMMVCEKEKYMFEKVLSLMYRSGSQETFSPKLYSSTESGMLIIENLYKDWTHIALDSPLHSLEECETVFKAVARFHALSISQLDEDVYSSLDSLTPVGELVENSIMGFAMTESTTKYCERISGLLPSHARNEVERMITTLRPMLETVFSRSRNGFNVVLQGNVRRRNIVFQFDNAQPSAVIRKCKFVDFRSSRLGSPVLDLIPYLLGSVEFDVFEKNADSLFNLYVTELQKSLADLNRSSQYDLTKLYADLRHYKSYFVFSLIFHVPMQWKNQSLGNVEETLKLRLETPYSEKFMSFLGNWMNVFTKW